MRKTLVVTFLFIFSAAGISWSQTAIDQLSRDLRTIFDELGKDAVPNLQTSAVLNHGLGSAELGSFPRMYFSLSTGATVAPGVLEFTQDEEKFENFALIDQLLDETGLNDDDVRDITDNYAPYPSMRAGVGVGLARGYELSFQVGLVPEAVTDPILETAVGEDDDGEPLTAPSASITTVSTRLRKVLVRRDRRIPAISAGVGYVYSGIDFNYDLAGTDPLELSGPDTTLDVDGTATWRVMTHSIGFDVRASTRFLRISYPFIGVSTYYQNSQFEAGVDGFSGTLNESTTNTSSNVTPNEEPFTERTFNQFNVVLNSGFDMKLAIFNLFAHVNYAVTTRAPGAVIGMRLQF